MLPRVDRASLRAREPWRGIDFAPPPSIPTMISSEEMDYLYWLGRNAWDGSSGVVEIGPWLGGSTWCLASGIEDNPRRSAASPLHVIDNFVWRPFMADRAALQLQPNDSFRPYFEQNLGPKRDLLVVHEANLPDDESADLTHDQPVRGDAGHIPILSGEELPEQIGIAFIDGAKSWTGLRHLLAKIAPRSLPGRTLLVLQDFKDRACYWIPLGVAALLREQPRCLEVVHVLKQNIVTLRVAKTISASRLDGLPEDISDISVSEGLGLIDTAATLIGGRRDPAGRAIVMLAGVSFLGAKGEWDEAIARFELVDRTWPWFGQPVGQLAACRRWLEARTGRSLPRSARARSARLHRGATGRMTRFRRAVAGSLTSERVSRASR